MTVTVSQAAPDLTLIARLAGRPEEDRARQLARALINTRIPPQGIGAVQAIAAEAAAYHALDPYPWWHFRDWKTEERGPYPRCMPFVRSAVRRGARWLFGKPVQIKCQGNTDLEGWLKQQWTANEMTTRMRAAAQKGAVQGGYALKFSYDETRDPPLNIQVLSYIHEVRFYYDPMDRRRLLMARVQYPYWDPTVGKWFIYREEWTDEAEVHYEPREAKWIETSYIQGTRQPYQQAVLAMGRNPDPDASEAWEIKISRPNAFGLIPIQPVKSLDADDIWGVGDLWGLFRVVDRVNLTYHLMDRSNQFDSEPNRFFIDLEMEEGDIDRALAPGQHTALKSSESIDGEQKKGQVVVAEARGSLRPAMMEYAKDVRKQILDAAASIEVDTAEVTNKGAMTEAVLTQLYGPLIEITEEKRETQGENGIAKFLEKVAVGLRNAGARVPEVKGVKPDDHDTFDVQLGWPAYFPLSEDEKTTKLARVTAEVGSGLTTHERAVQTVAQMEGVADIDVLQDELKENPESEYSLKLAEQAYQGGLKTRDEARGKVGLGPSPPEEGAAPGG